MQWGVGDDGCVGRVLERFYTGGSAWMKGRGVGVECVVGDVGVVGLGVDSSGHFSLGSGSVCGEVVCWDECELVGGCSCG